MDKKFCSKCHKEKDISEFHKTSRLYGAVTYTYTHSKCKVCRNKEKRIYNRKNKIKERQYNKKYYASHTPEFRLYYKIKKEKEEWQKKNSA